MPATPDRCHCGQPQPYADCCRPLHRGDTVATTAVQLMRSRYSAFCVHDIDYLLNTHYPAQRQSGEREDLAASCRQQRWVHLDIRHQSRGSAEDQQGEVEFVAWFLPADAPPSTSPEQLHERSRFIKEDQRWFYLDGELLPPLPARQPDTGRNAPCWCGSGRKFKHCHG